MKNRLWFIWLTASFLLFVSLAGRAQDKGVHFEHGLSWAAIQAKAKAENKYIFMDCFTTWCGPCRYMSTTIFPQEACGQYFNDKFVCVKVQLDSTAGDNDTVKSWYQAGHDLMQQYAIYAYPTFLVFAPDGHIVHRMVGGSADAKAFIERTADALNPDKQYYTLLGKYEGGNRDSGFLRLLATEAIEVYDKKNATAVGTAYLATQSDIYNKACLDVLVKVTYTTKDHGFDIFLHHGEKVDKVLGHGMAENKVTGILSREYVYSKIKPGTPPDWKGLYATLAATYPDRADQVITTCKVNYFRQSSDWGNFQQAVVTYMKKYGANASPEQLNDFAWTVFQNCPDMTCVTEALEWSKRSFKDNQNPGFMDTYANILYKMGKKDDAIAWEEKAINLSDEQTKGRLQPTLDKMKKGEKTWN
jgi:thiol-disulfide isomerase/thioredoxin